MEGDTQYLKSYMRPARGIGISTFSYNFRFLARRDHFCVSVIATLLKKMNIRKG